MMINRRSGLSLIEFAIVSFVICVLGFCIFDTIARYFSMDFLHMVYGAVVTVAASGFILAVICGSLVMIIKTGEFIVSKYREFKSDTGSETN